MAYRNKVYVCFDGDNDIHYYRLMCAWKQNDSTPFNFYNAHDLNRALDTSTEQTIKARLSERLRNSRVLVVLIGEQTRYLYRFVRWEMEQALGMEMPIIAVNLNRKRDRDEQRCPPVIRDALAIHISFNVAVMQYALEKWPQQDARHRSNRISGPRYYTAEVYQRLGL